MNLKAISAMIVAGALAAPTVASTLVVDTFDVGFLDGGGAAVNLDTNLESVTQSGAGIFTGLPGSTDQRYARCVLSSAGTVVRSFQTTTPGFADISAVGTFGSLGTLKYELAYGNPAVGGDNFDLSAFDTLTVSGMGSKTAGNASLELRIFYADNSPSQALTYTFANGAVGDIDFDLSGIADLDGVSYVQLGFSLAGVSLFNRAIDFTYSIDQISFSGPTVVPLPGGAAMAAAGLAIIGLRRRRQSV